MDLKISGKHALVTGGSRGLGKQSAIALGNEGVNVSICARGEKDLANATKKLEKLGISVSGFLADLSKKGSAKKIFSEVTKSIETCPFELLKPELVISKEIE